MKRMERKKKTTIRKISLTKATRKKITKKMPYGQAHIGQE
jgi:hypothetical protein